MPAKTGAPAAEITAPDLPPGRVRRRHASQENSARPARPKKSTAAAAKSRRKQKSPARAAKKSRKKTFAEYGTLRLESSPSATAGR